MGWRVEENRKNRKYSNIKDREKNNREMKEKDEMKEIEKKNERGRKIRKGLNISCNHALK